MHCPHCEKFFEIKRKGRWQKAVIAAINKLEEPASREEIIDHILLLTPDAMTFPKAKHNIARALETLCFREEVTKKDGLYYIEGEL